MKLLVIRHAVAQSREEFAHTSNNDDLRPLTSLGKRKMKRNVRGLIEMVERPDLLVTSPLTRACETAEIIGAEWQKLDTIICEELRPTAEPIAFQKWLKPKIPLGNPEALIAIIGHEPHLSHLISWFLVGETKPLFELKKGGACLIDFRSDFGKGNGKLQWLATPPMMRACR